MEEHMLIKILPLNLVFINDKVKQSIRLEKLNKIAISQMRILNENDKNTENLPYKQ